MDSLVDHWLFNNSRWFTYKVAWKYGGHASESLDTMQPSRQSGAHCADGWRFFLPSSSRAEELTVSLKFRFIFYSHAGCSTRERKKKQASGCTFICRQQRKHSSYQRVEDLSALQFVLHKQKHNQKVTISYIFECVHVQQRLPGAFCLLSFTLSFFCKVR